MIGKQIFAFLLTEEGSEKKITSTMKIPGPPLIRKWLLPKE